MSVLRYYDPNSSTWKLLAAKNGIFYIEDTASTDDYKVTLSGITLEKGLNIDLKVNTANTGAARFSIDNGVTYKDIVKNINTALATGDILANQIISLEYDGTNWLYKNLYRDATTSASGLMSASDKTKLDGLSEYSHPSTHPATMITLSTTNFNNNLDSSIDTTQKLADAVDNLSISGGITNYFCSVYLSTNQSLTASRHYITFDSELEDNNGMHSTSTNTDRITVSSTGLYLVEIYVYKSTTNVWNLELHKNGNVTPIKMFRGDTNVSCGGTYVIRLSANDYLNVAIDQTSYSGTEIYSGSNQTYFAVTKIGS